MSGLFKHFFSPALRFATIWAAAVLISGTAAAGQIGDFVWNDLNEDGIQDAGEPGAAGVMVELLDCDDTVLVATTTDGGGIYLFDGLAAGQYRIRVTAPTGSMFSPQDVGSRNGFDSDVNSISGSTSCLTQGDNQVRLGIDAGLIPDTGTGGTARIGDLVWDDLNEDGIQDAGEPGVAGVTVELQSCNGDVEQTAVTDSNGNYMFGSLDAGQYQLHFVPPTGKSFSPQDVGSQNGRDSDVNVITGMTNCLTQSDGQVRVGIDAGLIADNGSGGAARIGDLVWEDHNEDGIQDTDEPGFAGVTVELLACNGPVQADTVTDANGNYLFTDLDAGQYQIRVIAPDGTAFSPQDAGGRNGRDSDVATDSGLTSCVTQSEGQIRLGIDAGLIPDDTPGVADHPNILFILADDMGAETSSVYPALAGDSGQIPSPNLEALAASGLVFENAWANPVCTPTRGTLISGRYGHNTGVTTVGDDLDPSTTNSIFEYISSDSPENYAMAVFGKWHLGDNVTQHGVPVFKGFIEGGITNYFNWAYEDQNGNSTSTTTYSTTALTDFAIQFIADHQQNNPLEPWFVYLAYNAPHATIGANGGFQVPPADLHSVNLGNLQPGDIQDSIPVYQAMIQAMDTEIGRLLDAIGPVGSTQRDNTIVIFMGDNGTPRQVKDSNTGVRGNKSNIQEGGVKVPLIISGAGVTRTNAREDTVVVSPDLYATIAALSGIAVSQVEDGHSLVPVFSDATATPGREYGFTELCNNRDRYSVRNTGYKLSYDNGTWELFDLINDPLESNNLYNNPAYANERTTLESELASLAQNASAGCFQ